MKGFDDIGASNGCLEDFPGMGIKLDFPLVFTSDFYYAPIRTHIQTIDVLPTADFGFWKSYHYIQDFFEGNRGDLLSALFCRGLNPLELIFYL